MAFILDFLSIKYHIKRVMAIVEYYTDTALLAEVGRRLMRVRLERNMTQAELAREAGVGVRTVQRLETGASASQLSIFLRVCRVLGILEGLDVLLPDTEPGPLELLHHRGAPRKRATGSRARTGVVAEPWRWGDSKS